MTPFTGFQYLLIDIANQFGLDKDLFEQRIEWVNTHMQELETLAGQADSKPLYLKAVMTLRKAQAGLPSGHLVAMDAVCSGIQIMSALTGCVVGATHTGLVDPTVRADAYTTCTKFMNEELVVACTIPRNVAKDALMTTMYGSKAKPKEIFGEDTPELVAFYAAAEKTAPGAWELLQVLRASWQPYALKHSWKLPDGYDAVVKVMEKKEARIEVDELNHATFTYEFYVNEGSKQGLSNIANVVHSVDAYVLRSIHRRCNYNKGALDRLSSTVADEYFARKAGFDSRNDIHVSEKLAYCIAQYERSGMADVVIMDHLNCLNVGALSTEHLDKLNTIMRSMVQHKPFEVVTIHDSFACHANNMNHLRQHYIDIFAELAESNLLDDLLSQIHGTPGTFTKLSNNLGDLIRGSNYGLS